MIILDTHIFLWMILQSNRIPAPILETIDHESVLGVSAITLWETAMLAQRGRISLPENTLDWLRRALRLPKIRLLPLSPEIVVLAESLAMHGDPADRLLAATAIECNCRLATVDRRLLDAPMVQAVV